MDILVVGLGSMGKRRIRLLNRFFEIENIVGIDGREDRRKEVENLFGCETCSSIAEAVRKYPKITGAFVCTSPLSHSELITDALNHNLHVFTEINLVSDGYAKNMKLAEEKGKILFLSSTFLYREEIQYISKYLKCKDHKGNLNYIYHIGQYLPDWHPWENYKEFFVGNVRTNGCREILAIELPWLLDIFGQVEDINIFSDNISKLDLPYRDNYMIQIRHKNGDKGALVVDIVSPKAVRLLEIYGENIYLSWDGTPLGLKYYDPKSRELNTAQLLEKMEHVEGYSDFVVENAYQNEIKAFLDAISGAQVIRYGFREDLNTLRLIDRIEAENEKY